MKNLLLKCTTFFLLLVSFSVVAVNVAAQDKKDLKKAEKISREGDRLSNKKDFQGAIKKYAEAIALVDSYAYAHFWKGNAHYYLKENGLALEELNKAASLGYTPLIKLYTLRWYLNYTQKNYDEALNDLKKGIAIEPNNMLFKAGLGDVYYAKGSYQEAVNAYKNIIEKIPSNGNTYYSLADSYYHLGDTAGQKASAEKAVQKGTQYMSEAFLLIGKANQKEKKYSEAAVAYEKSITIKKDSYETYRNLSDVYRNMNRFDDAVQVTKKALEVFPRDGNLYTDLSWYYSLADRHSDAIGAAQIAISLLPDKFQAYTYLCRGLNDLKEYQKAIIACKDALKLNPQDGETNFYIGRAYELSGKPDVAAKYYKEAVEGLIEYTKRYSDFADGYYLLGNAYYSTGVKNKAIEAYIKSLEFSPKFKKARFNLGYVYIQNGDLTSAEAQYVALLELDKDLAGKLKEAMTKK